MRGILTYTLTFTGSAQRLSEALDDPTVGGPDDVPLSDLSLQPDGDNDNRCYFGSTSDVASTTYGFSLPPGDVSANPPPPYQVPLGRRPIKLSQLWVKGTAAQKLHIWGVEV